MLDSIRPPGLNDAGTTSLGATKQDLSAVSPHLSARALDGLQVFRDEFGVGWLTSGVDGRAYRIGSEAGRAFVHRRIHAAGHTVRARELREVMEGLSAVAQLTDDVRPVWYRIAPLGDAIVIDLGNSFWVKLSASKVEVIEAAPDVQFERPPTMASLPVPAERGDLSLLKSYWIMSDVDRMLMRALATYFISHAKRPGAIFPILLLIGPEGIGKSVFCKLLSLLIDPTTVPIKSFPKNERDLAIAAQKSHLLCFDNLRRIPPPMADALCITASGGSIETRKLFTDADTVVHRLHAAVVLNGIHSFADQQDLIQRCIRITLRPVSPQSRRPEQEILESFKSDLPVIFRGLLDLAAGILAELPNVKATDPERLVSFCNWLAALERVEGVPEGIYQSAYSATMGDILLDGLLDDPVAAAVLEFMEGQSASRWRGTPVELLSELDALVGRRASFARDWPSNEIALGRRLRALEGGLSRQGIVIETGRGRKRWISITRMDGPSHD
jgi:hypothetical protein